MRRKGEGQSIGMPPQNFFNKRRKREKKGEGQPIGMPPQNFFNMTMNVRKYWKCADYCWTSAGAIDNSVTLTFTFYAPV